MEFINTCFETTNSLRFLALYSHLLPVIVSVILTYFILKNSSRKTPVILFSTFTTLLSLWLVGDLVLWHSNNYYYVAAFWSTLDYINILFYLVLVCFFYTQTTQRNKIPEILIFIFTAIAFAPLLFTIGGLSAEVFDEPNCEIVGNELLSSYKLLVEVVSIISIILLYIVSLFKTNVKSQSFLLTFSTCVFLAIFSGSEYLATQTEIYEINLYALFALPIFLVIITFSIVEQNTFKIKVDSFSFAKILFTIFSAVAIFNLVLADDRLEFLVTGASTIVTAGFGLLLLRSARREVKQREQIEQLAVGLERANERLQVLDKQKSEFVSIASHQLRSPLTAIRGYVSMMVEGSFGKLPEKASEALGRIAESTVFMASSIDDFLEVSRIESGNMKYDYKDMNFKEQAEHIVDDLRADAVRRGLLLMFRSDMNGTGMVHADAGKTQQILHNLINNALKYTPKGSVTVYAHDDDKNKKMYVDIIDTGLGLSHESLQKLFGKFARAKVASSANIMGTGLGLFVAREMARAMGGDITVTSEGEGLGSTFTIVLPLI